MIAFIDIYHDQFGVELICRVPAGSYPRIPDFARLSGRADAPALATD
jgi:hypothetical protein